MEDVLIPLVVLGTIALGVIALVKTLTDYYLKRRLIENGQAEEASNLLKSYKSDNSLSSLKWGLLVLFGGIGLVIIEFIPYHYRSPLPYGIVAVSLSLGFLIYYFIARRQMEG